MKENTGRAAEQETCKEQNVFGSPLSCVNYMVKDASMHALCFQRAILLHSVLQFCFNFGFCTQSSALRGG